ncbi:hypothetical protein SM18210_21450, partial [Xanthomonas hortorum pv. gardneri]
FAFAAGRLPAGQRGTRCKYVPLSSYAASMPRKVPQSVRASHLPTWSGADGNCTAGRAYQAVSAVFLLAAPGDTLCAIDTEFNGTNIIAADG